MRLRKLAGTTASALVFGTLAVPMLATPAHAAPATAEVAFSATCTWTTRTLALAGTLAVTVDGAAVAATLSGTTNLNAASLNVSKLAPKLSLDIDGEAVDVSGESTFSPTVAGNTAIAIPAMSGTRTATAHPSTFDVTAATVTATIQYGAGLYNCAFTDIAPASFPAPPKDLSLACSYAGTSFAYNTDLTLAAQTKKNGKILVSAGLADDMPNTAPSGIVLPNQTFTATLGTAAGDLVGSRTGEFHGGAAVAIPAMTGLVTGSGSTVAVTVEDFSLSVGNVATIPCTLAAPKTFTIDAAAKTPVCVTAEAAYPTAQTGVATATTSANATAAAVTAASGKAGTASAAANAATASVKKADASVKKAAASVKKATKAVKKAKKAKKAKAKKALAKAKKAQTSAKKASASAKSALAAANGQLAAANGELAAAQGKATAANSQLATAKATLAAAQTAYDAC